MNYPITQRVFLHGQCNKGSAAQFYVPWASVTDGVNAAVDRSVVMRYAGRFVSATVRSESTTMGSTTAQANVDEVDIGNATETHVIDTADTNYVFTFSGLTFAKGSKVALAFTPSGATDEITVELELEIYIEE